MKREYIAVLLLLSIAYTSYQLLHVISSPAPPIYGLAIGSGLIFGLLFRQQRWHRTTLVMSLLIMSLIMLITAPQLFSMYRYIMDGQTPYVLTTRTNINLIIASLISFSTALGMDSLSTWTRCTIYRLTAIAQILIILAGISGIWMHRTVFLPLLGTE